MMACHRLMIVLYIALEVTWYGDFCKDFFGLISGREAHFLNDYILFLFNSSSK